jgi:hypothetical protein
MNVWLTKNDLANGTSERLWNGWTIWTGQECKPIGVMVPLYNMPQLTTN